MAHPLYNKKPYLNQRAFPESAAHPDDDAYLIYQSQFHPHTTVNLLQAALDTETIRDAQFLEGTDWQESVSTVPKGPMPHPDTTVLGSLVSVLRKSSSDFAARKELAHPQHTSHRSPVQTPPLNLQENNLDTHTMSDNTSAFHVDNDHDAYMFYTSLSQSHTMSNLLQVALETEAVRDAQVVEGSQWQDSAPLEHQMLVSDTAVLGALVGLFGGVSRR